LAWITTEAAERGYTWHYSVGFDITEAVRDAITTVPGHVWRPALTPDDKIRRGAHVTEITGLLTLADGWQDDLRVLARTEPLHPRHRKQASDVEKRRGQRFQAIATDLPGHHYPRLDAFGRNHAGVESVIKDGKDLGLRRLPGHTLAFNQAWCATVAIAADLLAWLRLLALDHHQRLSKATPATLRRTLPGAPARLIHHAPQADHPPGQQPPAPSRPHPGLEGQPGHGQPTITTTPSVPTRPKAPTRPARQGIPRATPGRRPGPVTPEPRNDHISKDRDQSPVCPQDRERSGPKIVKDLGWRYYMSIPPATGRR
jgi:hypothetical protein